MSRIARTTTLVILGALALGGGYGVYRALKPAAYGGTFRTYVYFHDAKGLPVGSRVKIAGIVVGEIESLTIENGQARLGLRLADDVVLWDDAWAEKKAASPLADNYVELSPGGPEPGAPPGARRRLRSGEPIARVLETSTTDKVLRGLERAIPRAVERVNEADVLTDHARQWVAGPLSERLARLDRQLSTGALADRLHAAADTAEQIDRRLAAAQAQVAAMVPAVDRGLDALVIDTASARDRIAGGRRDVATALAEVRTDLDRADEYARQAEAALTGITGSDDRGRLGRLIDEPGVADDLEETTGSLAAAARDLDRLRALLGMRAEWNLVAGAPRIIVSAEITSGGPSYYLIELEKGPWGDVPETTLTQAPDGSFVRSTRMVDDPRFTAQWGRRFGPLGLRAGLKESMFGVGLDAVLMGGRLRLSVDALESNFSTTPRLKMIAALQAFRSLYVLGGVDDVLVAGANLPITNGPEHPSSFSRLHYGRDFVLGLELRFTDPDVSTLLRLYGAFIVSLFT